MTTQHDTIDVPAALARMRYDLVLAVGADAQRARRRRRTGALVLVLAATLGVVGVSLAATALFRSAPESVKQTLRALPTATGVDASQAVRIGVIDDHAAYAAPKAGGGFCLYFAANPRSGPNGAMCTPRNLSLRCAVALG